MSWDMILIIVSSGDEEEQDRMEKSKAHFKATGRSPSERHQRMNIQ